MDPLLTDRVATITGAGSGIGRAISLAFAREGAHLALLGRNMDKLEETHTLIMARYPTTQVQLIRADVGEEVGLKIALDEVLKAYGRCDILVNNAGITRDNLLMKMSRQEWDEVLSINLTAVYTACHHLQRVFLKQRSGSIINISSVVGLLGNAGQCNYSAAKAGMIGFSKSLAREMASRHVRVNVIAPGFVDSEMTQELPSDLKLKALESIPLRRFGDCDEIAHVALFLASDMSAYMTGQVISVDGGLCMA